MNVYCVIVVKQAPPLAFTISKLAVRSTTVAAARHMRDWILALRQGEMFAFVAQVAAGLDVRVLKKGLKGGLRNCGSYPDIVLNMVGRDKKVENVVDVEVLPKSGQLSLGLV